MEICSLDNEVLLIKKGVTEMLATLKRIVNLQGTVNAIGGGNPHRLVRCVPKSVLDPALTDTGFAARVADAVRDVDLLSRENGYLALAKALREGCEDLRRKAIKIDSRLGADSGAGSEGEAVAAKRLADRLRSSLNALEGKLALALGGLFAARRDVLAELVRMDGVLRAMWPDGSALLRTAALKGSATDQFESLAQSEAAFRRGEFRDGRKRVKI